MLQNAELLEEAIQFNEEPFGIFENWAPIYGAILIAITFQQVLVLKDMWSNPSLRQISKQRTRSISHRQFK